jgi:hypothetical protein
MKCYLKHKELEEFGGYIPTSLTPAQKRMNTASAILCGILAAPVFLLGLLFIWTFGVPLTIAAIIWLFWKVRN